MCDVFVMPSRAENFPCTILECMSAGTPVIASNVGGIPEIITKDTGWLFNYGDKFELVKLIENLGSNKDLEKKGRYCRKYILNNYSESAMIKRYYEIYQSVLKK